MSIDITEIVVETAASVNTVVIEPSTGAGPALVEMISEVIDVTVESDPSAPQLVDVSTGIVGPTGPTGPAGPVSDDEVVTFPTGSEPSLVGIPDGTVWIEYDPT